MQAHINGYKESLNTIRAGRANPSLVENINFSYYGTDTPIKNAATITVPEARLLVVQPWDASALKEIEKAIIASDLGITPSNDGKVIRLPFPVLTEERRKELVKEVSKRSEQSKVGIRNIRRDLIDLIKKAEKDSEINEDEKKTYEKQAQELTDEFIDKIVEITKAKEAELMEV
ncbi:MAG: ribosome recycling factor [Tissierellia bacterium]|nr:ribosome recycling factor [Tissierellia bacterium]